MKKLTLLFSVLFLTSCIESSGPVGPQGPQGPQGPAGPVGQGFEVEASFDESNGYSEIFAFPSEVEVLETDIVAVYLLWDVDSETGNDIWQPLPVSVFFDDGELQYAFDHTVADVQLFLTGDTDLSTVGDEFTQNQIFRVAILPVDYVQNNNIDMSKMEEVMGAMKMNKLPRLEL